jgi:uncharacterized protein (DUF2062 family)
MASTPGKPDGYLRRRIGGPLLELLTQGASPQAIAECVVLGVLIGLVPLFGTSTIALTIIAARRRLNLAAIHAVNWLMVGPQLALWIPFMRFGERLLQSQPLPLRPEQFLELLQRDALEFMRHFGTAGMHALTGWIVLCLPLSWVCYVLLVALLRHARVLTRPA